MAKSRKESDYETHTEVEGSVELGIVTNETGEPLGLEVHLEINKATQVTRRKGSKSFSMPGSNGWNSTWEPKGPPKPPYSANDN